MERLGRTAVERLDDLRDGLAFIGQVTMMQLRALRSLRRLRPISIVRHVYDTGITAIPIVSLIAFLISVIIAYLSASQLRNYGADIYVVDLITVGVLRELGVLLTAIIVAGRTGSAFAAEIGSMKLNEEIDALDATGVDPVETLVLPRILGLVIALPLLTFIADIIGSRRRRAAVPVAAGHAAASSSSAAPTRPSRRPRSGSASSRRRSSRC